MCSPTRACLLTGRNHHTCAMGGITDLAMGFPGYHGRIPKSCGFVSRGAAAGRLGDVRGRQVAPGAVRRAARRRAARSLAARPGLRALLRLPRRRDEPVRARSGARQPARPLRSAARLPPDRGPRRSGDRHDHRRARRRSRQAVLPLPRARAPATRRTRRRASGSIATAVGSTTAGTCGASETLARQIRLGVVPAGTRLSARPSWVQEWASLPRREQRLAARMMEVYAGFLSHTDHHLGRLLDFLRRTGELDRTLVLALSRQRRQRRGRPARDVQRELHLQRPAARPRGHAGAPRRARRPEDLRSLPVGLGAGRQHAVPALEARDARGRHRRSADRALAGRARPRRGAPAVRARHRRRRDDPRREPASPCPPC